MSEWNIMDSLESFENALNTSFVSDVLIFKHSTTCSISHLAKMRLEDNWDIENVSSYYLDLKRYRIISDTISEKLNVHHESPQVLLIRRGQCIYDASHFDISVEEVKETMKWHNEQKFASGNR